MDEWVTLTELHDAYLNCKHRKGNTEACAIFESNLSRNLIQLHRELNNGTYQIGYSNAFCVTRPKAREVFAAEFRDRIVHHLLIMRTLTIFEDTFIDDTYNCRAGKGTSYGHLRMLEMANEYADGWVLCCDIKSCFPSIRKTQLADELEEFLVANYHGKDLKQVVWLTRMIALHEPQNKCIRKGDLNLWKLIALEKSLFTCAKGLGMAIGNLTSQIYVNFHLSPVDKFLYNMAKIRHGRYVDDLRIFAHTNRELVEIAPKLREFLKNDRHMTLHPTKISIQPVRHGFDFIGATIRPGRIYVGKRTVANFMNMVRLYNALPESELIQSLEKFVQRYNSYSGYLKHYQTYALHWIVWNSVDEKVKKYVYLSNKLCVLHVRNQYKKINKIKQDYNDLRKHSIQQLHSLKQSAS